MQKTLKTHASRDPKLSVRKSTLKNLKALSVRTDLRAGRLETYTCNL